MIKGNKLPDRRYAITREFCGYERARYVPRFCGEWIRSVELWPDRSRGQAPAFRNYQGAVDACYAYEDLRQKRMIAEAKGEES